MESLLFLVAKKGLHHDYMLEHEITHRGELSQILGGLGLDGVYGTL